MLKIVVVDDEPLALEVIEGYLRRTDAVEPVLISASSADVLSYLQLHTVDLLFLDIEMPGISGIDFLKQLAEPPLTVFTTAYRNYAFDGYELGVIDFLLKPFSFDRFAQAVSKARDFLDLRKEGTVLLEPAPEFIFVKSGVKRIKLFFDEVTHIQGLKDYAIIHTSKENIVVKGPVKAVQEMLPAALFTRVHKSFVVRTKAITRIDRNRIIIGPHQVPIGRNYRDEVEKIVNTGHQTRQ